MKTPTTQRLIDANALIANLEKVEKEIRKGELPKRYLPGLVSSIAYIKKSAPTVETTKETEKDSVDSVLARLPKEYGKRWLTIGVNDDGTFFAGYAEILEYERQDSYQKIELGDSFLESVKKLEASLN